MKRRRFILIGALAVVMAGIALCWPRGPREPVYQGKRLTEWIKETRGNTNAQAQVSAERAVKTIGTNALPFLMYQFTRPIHAWRDDFNRWAASRPIIAFRFDSDAYRASLAMSGLIILGADITPALPTLSEYLGDPKCGDPAAWVLKAAGPAAHPYLLRAVSSANQLAVRNALDALDGFLELPDSSTPLLIPMLNHTNVAVRQFAIRHLATARQSSELVVPALVKALSDPDPGVRRNAAMSLVLQGAAPKAAIPELLQLMKDFDAGVVMVASNAIFRIDPSALPARP